MTECKVLNKSEIVINLLQWINIPRRGQKNGKQKTQLEIGLSKLPIKIVVRKLAESLQFSRQHMI